MSVKNKKHKPMTKPKILLGNLQSLNTLVEEDLPEPATNTVVSIPELFVSKTSLESEVVLPPGTTKQSASVLKKKFSNSKSNSESNNILVA